MKTCNSWDRQCSRTPPRTRRRPCSRGARLLVAATRIKGACDPRDRRGDDGPARSTRHVMGRVVAVDDADGGSRGAWRRRLPVAGRFQTACAETSPTRGIRNKGIARCGHAASSSSSSVDRGSPTRVDDQSRRGDGRIGSRSSRSGRPRRSERARADFGGGGTTTVQVASSEARGFLGRSDPSDVTPPRRRTSRTRFAYAVPSGPTIEPVVRRGRRGGRRRGGHDNLSGKATA